MFFDSSLISTESAFPLLPIICPPASDSACSVPQIHSHWKGHGVSGTSVIIIPSMCISLTEPTIWRHMLLEWLRRQTDSLTDVPWAVVSPPFQCALRGGRGRLWIPIVVPLLISCVFRSKLGFSFIICKNRCGFGCPVTWLWWLDALNMH